jgi:hypothetical protein
MLVFCILATALLSLTGNALSLQIISRSFMTEVTGVHQHGTCQAVKQAVCGPQRTELMQYVTFLYI